MRAVQLVLRRTATGKRSFTIGTLLREGSPFVEALLPSTSSPLLQHDNTGEVQLHA
jgi:hypothetical protein